MMEVTQSFNEPSPTNPTSTPMDDDSQYLSLMVSMTKKDSYSFFKSIVRGIKARIHSIVKLSELDSVAFPNGRTPKMVRLIVV